MFKKFYFDSKFQTLCDILNDRKNQQHESTNRQWNGKEEQNSTRRRPVNVLKDQVRLLSVLSLPRIGTIVYEFPL